MCVCFILLVFSWCVPVHCFLFFFTFVCLFLIANCQLSGCGYLFDRRSNCCIFELASFGVIRSIFMYFHYSSISIICLSRCICIADAFLIVAILACVWVTSFWPPTKWDNSNCTVKFVLAIARVCVCVIWESKRSNNCFVMCKWLRFLVRVQR